MSEIYSLGLRDSDRVATSLGGGFPQGSVVFIEGPDGGGKSVLSQRFVYGFCDEGYYTTYISPEITGHKLFDQMASLSYPVEDHILTQQLLFLNADVDTFDALTGDGSSDRELVTRLFNAEAPWLADIIVIDGLDVLLTNDPAVSDRLEERGKAVVENFLSYLSEYTSEGKTIILTANPNALDDSTLRPLRNRADVYFTLETAKIGSEITRNIRVNRYSEMQAQVDDNVGFSVQTGNGIIIETRTIT
jgi:flagellar protein FlaH